AGICRREKSHQSASCRLLRVDSTIRARQPRSNYLTSNVHNASRNSNHRLHARQAKRLATMKRLAISNADCFAPISRLLAKLIEKSRRLSRSPLDELAVIATNRRQLLLPIGADIEHE